MLKPLFTSIALYFCVASTAVAADISLENPWVREAPPTAKKLAGYVIIKNVSAQKVVLKSVSSPDFEKVEFHITTFEGGMMRMKEIHQLELGPGESEEFEPGGRHLMLINPRKKLRDGDMVPMSIVLSNGKSVSFQMLVRR